MDLLDVEDLLPSMLRGWGNADREVVNWEFEP